VKKRLEQIIDEIVHEHQWPLIELAIQPDHVHLFVRTLPSPLPSAIPRLIKGRSSRLLRQEFAHLQRLPVLWSPSSFLSTAGHVSSETIARYLQQQSEYEEVPASPPAPDKERPFIPVLERTGLSGPFSVIQFFFSRASKPCYHRSKRLQVLLKDSDVGNTKLLTAGKQILANLVHCTYQHIRDLQYLLY
jgi:putative transposase